MFLVHSGHMGDRLFRNTVKRFRDVLLLYPVVEDAADAIQRVLDAFTIVPVKKS